VATTDHGLSGWGILRDPPPITRVSLLAQLLNFALSLVFFTAHSDATGRELWAVPVAALADGDQDGLEDQAEVAEGTNPDDADSDDDGLSDGAEVLTHGTDPLDADTDDDGWDDGSEVAFPTDPLDPESFPPSSQSTIRPSRK